MSLLIDPTTIPEEGVSRSGTLPAEIFDFPAHDDAKPVSPLRYDILVQRFGSELLLTGELSATFELTCVITMQRFTQTIQLDHVAIAIELENELPLDIADELREEIVIEMPHDPRCDQGDVPMVCENNSLNFLLDKNPENDPHSPPPTAGDNRWEALDALQQRNDNI
jgi:uncharacterized metal-binding protein YceD (DUF177 family)